MVDEQRIKDLCVNINQDVISWRRYLHEHPEVSFEEVETAQYIFDVLSTFPHLELSRPTKTSVLARLVTGRKGLTLALRADIDALPIDEENDVSYRSKTSGTMHACGHDGHTAMLLGAAKVLSELRDELIGEIRFIFQHAEELVPGGAQELIREGVLDGVDAIVGQHLWQPIASQKIGLASGAVMASPDTFYITIHGHGGHAGRPQDSIDPILIGAQVVTNLQQIASRYVDPLDPFVLSVTKFIGGTADNVIPNSVDLAGTVRAFRNAVRDEAETLMERVIRGITEAHGATYEFRYERGYAPVVNHVALTGVIETILKDHFGSNTIAQANPIMFGEDFSAYQQTVPGTFFFTGIYNADKDVIYPHHHPQFNIDEDALAMGLEALLVIATRLPDKFSPV